MSSSLLLVFSMFSFSAFSSVKITEGLNTRHFDFSVDSLKLQTKTIEGETFDEANLVGVDGYTGIKYELGSPEVPVIRFFVKAEKASDVIVTFKDLNNFKAFHLAYDLKPVMASVAKLPGRSYSIIKNQNFKSTSAYPQNNFEVTASGSVNHEKQFMVTLYPVQFSGLTKSLQITKEFSVDVKKIPENKSVSAMSGLVFVVGAKFKNSPRA